MEFEDGLSTSVLKNKATCNEHVYLEIENFLKKSTVFKPRPPTLFHTLSRGRRSRTMKHVRVSNITGTHTKERVMVQSRFYSLSGTMVKLHVGLALA
jgi:hypothetical protein